MFKKNYKMVSIYSRMSDAAASVDINLRRNSITFASFSEQNSIQI